MQLINEHAVPSAYPDAGRTLEAETARLIQLIYLYAPHDGAFDQRIPGLFIGRYSRVDMDNVKTFYSPSLGIVVQGAKNITVGKEVHRIGQSDMFVTPAALPVAVQTTQASHSEPLLGVRLDLDPQRIAELVLKVYPQGLPPIHERSACYVTHADLGIVRTMSRLIEYLFHPGDAELLAPLAVDEILIRLLRSPVGVHVAEMGFADSEMQPVVKAIAWLRDNFSQQIKVENLAELEHMSVSTFYKHFKSVTSMSPLQYQKALRLQEARHLMLSRQMDATTACRLVGYVSDSQFSRDYSAYFGRPPRRDVSRLLQREIIMN